MNAEDSNLNPQVAAFGDDLDKLVDRYRHEWDLPYAAVVGALFAKATLLVNESAQRRDELGDDPES